MPRFDAELYLRLIGEEMLLDSDPNRGHWSSPLDEAAGALIAVRAIPRARAGRVVNDYGLAQSLRSGGGHHHVAMWAQGSSRRRARVLKFKRVVPADTVIEDPGGRLELRYVLIGEQETSLAIVYRPHAGQRATHGRGRMFMMGRGGLPWGAPAPTLTDDRGNSATLSFSGGGSEAEWTGRLSAGDKLAADTRWLELEGQRIALDATPLRAEVSTQELEESDPAHRHLWERLARQAHYGPPPSSDAAVDALIAAGALAPEDPVIAEVETVLERLPQHPHHNPGRRSVRNLPEPWRSLLRRAGKEDGPAGRIVLGAATPLFDGHRVGILSLESDAAGFNLEVEMSPAGMPGRFGGAPADPLAWWARDNRGNHYLGSLGGWSGGEDYASGEVNFWPAIDPRAERLELLPTTAAARAVIGFPLQWMSAGSRSGGPAV